MRSRTKSHRYRRGRGGNVFDDIKKGFSKITPTQIKAGLSLAGPQGRALATAWTAAEMAQQYGPGVLKKIGLGRGRGGKLPTLAELKAKATPHLTKKNAIMALRFAGPLGQKAANIATLMGH